MIVCTDVTACRVCEATAEQCCGQRKIPESTDEEWTTERHKETFNSTMLTFALKIVGAREMFQKHLAILPEDPDSIPSTHGSLQLQL